MEESVNEEKRKKNQVTKFPVPFSVDETNQYININTNNFHPKLSNKQLVKKAVNLHLKGNLQAAARYYQDCIDRGIDDARVYSNYGTILKDLFKLKAAEILTRKAIRLDPNLAMAHNNLGNILKEQGNIEEAELSIREAIKIDPKIPLAHSNLALILKSTGKSKEAEIYQKKALEIDPNSNTFFYYSGCLFENNKYENILKNLENAIDLAENEHEKAYIYSAMESTIIEKSSSINDSNIVESEETNVLKDKKNKRLIINRPVEDKLLSHLYSIKKKALDDTGDIRYGDGFCYENFNFFEEDTSSIISNFKNDIIKICKKELGVQKIFISESFFNIFKSGSGANPHTHIGERDEYFKLSKYKFSLIYYLDIGDQASSDPGILKLTNPEENILPVKGMLLIIGAGRKHSVSYKGNKDRVIIGTNFYGF